MMIETKNFDSLEDFIEKIPKGLKAKLLNLIENKGIKKLEDFKKIQPNKLQIKSLGNKSLYELNLLLTKEGYGFKTVIKKPNPTSKTKCSYCNLGKADVILEKMNLGGENLDEVEK